MANTRLEARTEASPERAKLLRVAMATSTRHELPAGLAAALRAARLERGLTLRVAAFRAGIAPAYLSQLETGKRCPSVAVAHDLAQLLELEADIATHLITVARPDAGRSSRWGGRRRRTPRSQ